MVTHWLSDTKGIAGTNFSADNFVPFYCENAKIGQPKIIVFGASKLKYRQLPGMKKTIFIGSKILFQ